MASSVVDWSAPKACTSALKLFQQVLVLDGENPLIHTDSAQVYKDVKVEMKVILHEKSEIWNGIIESKWGKVLCISLDSILSRKMWRLC